MYTNEALPAGYQLFYNTFSNTYNVSYDRVWEIYIKEKVCILDWTIKDIYDFIMNEFANREKYN